MNPLFLLSFNIFNFVDLLMLPVIMGVLIGIFMGIKNNRYKGKVFAKYLIPALLVRYAGALLTAAMYQFYYGYGDTFYYYLGVKDIFEAFIGNPMLGLEMIFMPYELYSQEALEALTYHLMFKQTSAGIVIGTGGFFSIFTFGSYLGVSLCFTTIAFVGSWCLYKVFYDLYPHLHFQLAIAILFIPSLCFWGTGLMKDPLSIGGLGMMVYGLYHLFIKFNKGFLLPLFFLIYGAYLGVFVKVYVIIALFPAMVVWLALLYKRKIKSKVLRQLAGPALLGLSALLGLVALQQIGAVFEKFSLENIVEEAAKTQWWLTVSTQRDGGTGYTLGEIDPTVVGILKKVPASMNVTLFRPYPWEARKIIVIPSALEALFSFLFTIFVFARVGIVRTLRELVNNPNVLFCLIFALLFAFAVGFTSMNFGALARYKIPCLPFFFTALIILLDRRNREKRLAAGLSALPTTQSQQKCEGLPLQ